jgi:hypothetical protein
MVMFTLGIDNANLHKLLASAILLYKENEKTPKIGLHVKNVIWRIGLDPLAMDARRIVWICRHPLSWFNTKILNIGST